MINDSIPNLLKALVKQSVDAMQISDWQYATVMSINPLKLYISEKETIDEEDCVLSDNVRDYEVDITVAHTTENQAGGGGYAEFASHNHSYSGRKKIIVHNGLVPGEKVIILKQQGGQRFYVADRVYPHKQVIGQWG